MRQGLGAIGGSNVTIQAQVLTFFFFVLLFHHPLRRSARPFWTGAFRSRDRPWSRAARLQLAFPLVRPRRSRSSPSFVGEVRL